MPSRGLRGTSRSEDFAVAKNRVRKAKRVTKAAQFRFGVPLKFTRRVAGAKTNDVGLVAVYTVQLGPPK
jgi:hypothetical protein